MELLHLNKNHIKMIEDKDVAKLSCELNTAREFVTVFADCFQSKLSVDELLKEDYMVKYSIMLTIYKFYMMGMQSVIDEASKGASYERGNSTLH